MTDSLSAAMDGEALEAEVRSWSYEELCAMDFKLLLPAEKYQYEPGTDTWVDMSATETGMDFLYNSDDTGTRLKVVGVARPNEESTAGMVTGALGYTGASRRPCRQCSRRRWPRLRPSPRRTGR